MQYVKMYYMNLLFLWKLRSWQTFKYVSQLDQISSCHKYTTYCVLTVKSSFCRRYQSENVWNRFGSKLVRLKEAVLLWTYLIEIIYRHKVVDYLLLGKICHPKSHDRVELTAPIYWTIKYEPQDCLYMEYKSLKLLFQTVLC